MATPIRLALSGRSPIGPRYEEPEEEKPSLFQRAKTRVSNFIAKPREQKIAQVKRGYNRMTDTVNDFLGYAPRELSELRRTQGRTAEQEQRFQQLSNESLSNIAFDANPMGLAGSVLKNSLRKAASKIAQSTEEEAIKKVLTKLRFPEKELDEAALSFKNVTDEKQLYSALRVGEVISNVEKKVGRNVPIRMRNAIKDRVVEIVDTADSVRTQDLNINSLVKEILDDTPKGVTIKQVNEALGEQRRVVDEILTRKQDDIVNAVSKKKNFTFDDFQELTTLKDKIEKNIDTPQDIRDSFEILKRAGIDVADEMGLSRLADDVKKVEDKVDELPPLIQEARKYKTEEEFIKAQFDKKPEYGMGHRPSHEGMPPAHNLLEGETLPRDVYDKPDWSIAGGRIRSGDKAANESWSVLQKIKNNPDADAILYRAGAKNELNTGDWVTFSRDYAKQSVEGSEKVHSFKAKAKDVIFAGDDINEFGYYPKSQLSKIYKEAQKRPENLAGVGAGVEKDEDGNVRIDPTKAALGVAGVTAVKNPKAQQVIEEAAKKYKNIAKADKFSIFKKNQAPIIKATSDSAIKRGFDKLLAPITTRLENINPELKNQMRKLEFSSMKGTLEDTKKTLPFLKAQSKLSAPDRALFDIARKNGDGEVIDAIASKYGIEKELKAVRETLDDIYTKGKQVGMEMEYRGDYFPRVIKDPKGFLEYLRGTDDWSQIDKAIKEKAARLEIHPTDLTDDQKASIVNSLLRGYGNKITLSAPGATKARTIDIVDENIDKFYEKTDSALVTYISRMNDEIAGRKFFGKELGVDGKSINTADSIGSYVMKLVTDGKITPSQEKEVSDILKARFNKGKMNEALQTFRNLEYMSTMGNPISALTQIGDMAWTVYDNGIYHSLKGLSKAAKGKGVTRTDLGVDRIAQEFVEPSKTAKLVEVIFKGVGLDRMDRLGKETLINGAMSKYTARAKKGDKKLAEELKKMFPTDEAKLAYQDFTNGMITDRTKYVLFNKLMDFQPASKSEMPQKYLEMPNGRIFYMLKSFTLKQIDVFRREVGRDIVSGDPKRVANGLKKFMLLGGSFMLANATADEIKDFVLGRETSLEDRTIDNLARLFGASKYDVYKVREEGLGAGLAKKILFPTSIADSISKDIETVLMDKEYKTGALKGEQYKLETTQRIPLAGKLYYWWMGRGSQKTAYKKGQTTTAKAATPKKTPIRKSPINSSVRKPLK